MLNLKVLLKMTCFYYNQKPNNGILFTLRGTKNLTKSNLKLSNPTEIIPINETCSK